MTTVDTRWFAPVTRLGIALDEPARLASWNSASDPEQAAVLAVLSQVSSLA